MSTSLDATSHLVSALQQDRCYHETVSFEVEGAVNRVLKHGLVACSSIFRNMFSLPQGANQDGGSNVREGESDDNPIKLVGYTNAEFKTLITVMYPLLGEIPELTKERWGSVLRVARLWDMPRVAKLAIGKLNTCDL